MNTISTILFFIVAPLLLVGGLSVFILRKTVTLIEAIAIGITIWVTVFLVISTLHPWPYQTDQLTAYLFLAVLPVAVTALTFRLTKTIWVWLLWAVGISIFLWVCFLFLLPKKSGYEGILMIGFMPVIAGVCCFSALLIKMGQPFEFALIGTSREAPYIRRRRLIFWLVAVSHLLLTVSLSQGAHYAYRQYERIPRTSSTAIEEPVSLNALIFGARLIGFPLVNMAEPTANSEEVSLHPDNWLLFNRKFWIAAVLNSLLVSYLLVRLFHHLFTQFRPRRDTESDQSDVSQSVDRRPFVLAGAMAVTCGLGYSFTPPKLDFGITGTVIDATSKQPISGAYVIAIYERSEGSLSRCIASRGTYSATNGKYELPVTELNYSSPKYVAAIKQSYYSKQSNASPKQSVNVYTDPKEYFTGRDILLTPQDLADPKRLTPGRYDDGSCEDAKSIEDASASIEFLKMELAESNRIGVSSDAAEKICRLQKVPSKQGREECKKTEAKDLPIVIN